MGKKFKRLLVKIIDICNYLYNVGNKIFKTLVQSIVICFPLALTFMLINSLLGTHIRFSFYFKLASIATLVVTVILCSLRFKAIFAKYTKVSKKTVPTKTNRKTQRTIHRKRRRIS